MNFITILSRYGNFSHNNHSDTSSGEGHTSFYMPESGMYVSQSKGSLWFLPLIIGLTFIVLSLILIAYPELLAFFFAGIMMFAGLFFVSTALFLRSVRNRN